jgi:hypothetical protein
VYLLCFDAEFDSSGQYLGSRHYIGWTSNIERRMGEHRDGYLGSKRTSVFARAGVDFTVARLWAGSIQLEDEIQRAHGLQPQEICPRCSELKGLPRTGVLSI